MSFASDEFDFAESQAPPPSLQWRSWPLRESLPAAFFVPVGLLAAGGAVRWVTGQTHLALVAVAALAIALWRFFLPVSFELNSEGVSQWVFGRRRRIAWREIRRYEVCSSGVLLLPRPDACPLDACRGLHLPWGKHRADVLAHIHYYLDRPSAK
jgi:hypothetical protein